MEAKPVDLYEFLMESELQHYYNAIKNDLKISLVSHLKYATDDDFKQLGMSRPEIRRLRKFYEKYFPHGYLSKIKRVTRDLLLQNSRKDDSPIASPTASLDSVKAINSPLKMPINKHIIPADAIVVNKQLGVGEFGVVQQGVWTNGNERIQVAIKCLCRERMQSNPMEFLKEAHIMHSIEHENIVRFYGVVLQTDTLMLVTELAPLRSLLECLKDPGLRVSFLTVPTLCEFALQICNGMMYLENKRLIHRDLAARNILVFNKNSVKISDFGLSRALGVGKDYYQSNLNVNLKLPIAWCAPECITFLRFTNASDVWAYAVCLWEMFSYGFQPWAALTGHQIFEAIDEPNFQRLEQPDCCPKDYYILMLKCWEHDPNKRPRFSEIYSLLPDMKPEQLKTRIACNDTSKKDHLIYRQEEIVTVLDKPVNSVYWKGVLNSGKTGYFNPANTVAFMDNFISNTNSLSGSFIRSSERSSKRKLRRDMISRPQNDLKHTGHIGIDGAYFGDVDFLSNAQNHNNHLPRQVVTPYKPSEDEQPLLQPPTPTSPDSIHNFTDSLASTSNRAFVNSNEANANNVHISSPLSMSNDRKKCGPTAFKFPPQLYNSSNPFLDSSDGHTFSSIVNEPGAFSNANMEDDTFSRDNKAWKDEFNRNSTSGVTNLHEYQEISDDEAQTSNVFNSLGPSLLDEVNLMLQSMTSSSEQCPKSPDYDHTSKQSDMGDVSSKLIRNNSYDHNGSGSGTLTNLRNKKKAGVKPLSVKDEKILNHAIDYANEISARSMTDLGAEGTNPLHSPKRKFSLRKPHMSGGSSGDHDPQSLRSSNGYSNTNTLTNKERRNFTEELQNLPDLQNSITKEHEDAYNNLVGNFTTGSMMHYDPEKLSIYKVGQDEFGLSSTLDRCEMRRKEHGNEFNVSKTHTLPVRRSTPIQPEEHLSLDDANPLRILRDKNYPIVRPRLRISTTQPESLEQLDNKDDSGCESPSYVINSDAPFTTDRDINMHSRLPKKELGKKEIENTNPLPLPPRDPNKTLPMYPKRHIRKHPLIIPVSRLQRTLDKVITPSDEKNGPQFRNIDGCLRKSGGEKSKVFELETQDNLNTLDHGKYLPKHCLSDDPGIDIPDSASQCFENILEDRNNKIIELNSPDIVDGFVCFDQPTISSSNDKSIYQNNSEMRDEFMKQMCGDDNIQNFNFDRKKFNFPAKYECQVNDNEKPKADLECMEKSDLEKLEKSESDKDVSKTTKSDNCEASLLSNSNSVSCEDLLQFSNRKPMGRERGIDSDEVRLMIKVLGKETDPETYMFVLELVNWDVLKAIKIIKLKNSWQTEFKESLSFERCHDILNEHDWDVRSAIFKRNGFK